ncbi:rod-binding protein [Rhizosaccharibacter radicis]|uniref:Rod-binding protein n=1 Tax=Rhizosaccharibacter radicis TaxID=2782605 RepID=A0ABT1W012_9PROT|nr:rod-binding protein [Acetobacteraceae bacterium KSS12]
MTKALFPAGGGPVAAADPAAPDATKAADPKLLKAAQDFEAMTIAQLLQPMFDTVHPSDGFFGGGAGEETFRPMLVSEMAKEMERHGGIGLAQPVYDEMLRMQEKRR